MKQKLTAWSVLIFSCLLLSLPAVVWSLEAPGPAKFYCIDDEDCRQYVGSGYICDVMCMQCVPDPSLENSGASDGGETGGNEEPSMPTKVSASNVPALQNFDMTENTYTANELNFTFAPKGTPRFYLHVNLKFENGQDVLSAWCTGDEKLCKAVGNGQACSGTDYTGANAWCYKADSSIEPQHSGGAYRD